MLLDFAIAASEFHRAGAVRHGDLGEVSQFPTYVESWFPC